MPSIEEWSLIALLALVVAIVWVAVQVRKLHTDLQPILESRIAQTLAEA